ncbi:MATE family efflux transporter [Sciscionella sediminilitoris]|uniref:MATE family efflux transporter n=1 Tax=Sciscionella sediminilitoris TaxID=1445613 RepID=UPI0004DF50C0|nr:MATE family efflux transporter [Sciscionella sp. SE31]
MTVTETAPRNGFRPLLALGTRLTGVQLAQVALTTTDIAMMGTLGVRAVAAGGLAALLYNQIRTMTVGMVTPAGNLVAGTLGRHESGAANGERAVHEEVRGVVRASFAVATVVGALAAGAVIGIGCVLPWFGQSADVVAVAFPMMAALAPGLIPMLWLQVLRQFAVGMHRAGSLLGVTIASIGVNLVLDGGFLYGWLGLPIIGVTGIGLATALVQLLSFLAYLLIVRRDPHLRPALSLRGWRAERQRVAEIVRLGTPACLTYGSEAGITSVATLVMGNFGPVALAAHNLVNQITYIVYQFSIGISQGASILVSRSVGRGDRAEPRRIAYRAFALAGALQLVLAAVYLLAPRSVLGLFLGSNDTVVFGTATTLLLLGIIQQITKGGQNIAVGLMRGLDDTKAGFRSSLVGYWGVGVPGMLLCAYVFGWAAAGVWVGLCLGFGATAVQLLVRFTRAEVPQR